MYIEYQPIVTVCVCLSRVVHSVIGLTARGPPQAVSFPCSRDGGPGRGGAGTPCPLPLPPRLHGTPGVRPLRCCTPSNSSTRTCTGRTRAWRSVVWTVNSLIALIPQLAHCSHTPTRSLLSYSNSLIALILQLTHCSHTPTHSLLSYPNSLIALIPQLTHCSHTPTHSLLSYPNSLPSRHCSIHGGLLSFQS